MAPGGGRILWIDDQPERPQEHEVAADSWGSHHEGGVAPDLQSPMYVGFDEMDLRLANNWCDGILHP